jgi:hypothetical protein
MGNLTDLKTVTWLEPCDFCSNTSLKVMTKNVDNSLNVLDQVFCNCGHTGYIDVQDDNAFVCWEDLTMTEVKYNKLKIMYDLAVYCLMESNYGDVNYLRKIGALE